MTDRTQVWSEIQQALTAIAGNLSPTVREKLEQSNIDLQDLFALGVAYYVHPDPIMLKHLRQRNPYSLEQVQSDRIVRLRDAEHLDSNDVITKTAYDAYQSLIDAQDAQAQSLDLIDADKLSQLVDYFQRAHDAALKLDAPCFKLYTSRPLPENSVHRIYYFIFRFLALRDDAHIQAWQDLNVDGHTYETVSLVWDGSATTAAKLLEIRQNRGYEESDWQATLDKLVEKGWLSKEGDEYAVTDEFKTLRDSIEVKTDDFFYSIFADFSDVEVKHLLTLLKEVQAKFTPEPEVS